MAEDDLENYFILYKSDFEQMQIDSELKNPQDEIYVVNYDKQELIYLKGFSVDGEIKYNILDIIGKQNL